MRFTVAVVGGSFIEYKSNEMIKTINEIIKYLKMCDHKAAEYYCNFLIYTLDQLNRPHELHKVAENILKIYGGMGTFGDIVIFANGEFLKKECDEFDDLRSILYSQCEAAIEDARK